jgi:hypothetical protein
MLPFVDLLFKKKLEEPGRPDWPYELQRFLSVSLLSYQKSYNGVEHDGDSSY